MLNLMMQQILFLHPLQSQSSGLKRLLEQLLRKNYLYLKKLQEQYWQRTHGTVRTALEQAVERLDKYGMVAEMGHKEVGGV